MSDSPVPATTVAAAPSPSTLASFFTVIHNAAGSIYHQAVVVEQDVAVWTASPDVKALVDDAVTLVEGVLTAHGIPVPALVLVAKTLFGALGTMAASDATITSGKTSS